MKKNEILSALEPLINIFNESGISYYVCGSLASSAYGISRMTQDVDLVSNVSEKHVNLLVERLKKDYFIDGDMIKEAIAAKSSFNLIHLETMMKIDVFILKEEPYHQISLKRKVEDKLEQGDDSLKVFFCTGEDIILSKLQWYKSGEEVSGHQWFDVLGVIKVQRENLDIDYLKHWAKELSIDKLLVKAFAECDIKIF